MLRKRLPKAAFVALWLASLSLGGAGAATEEAVIEGAKKEGQLVIYTAMTSKDTEKFVALYRKHYPFVEVKYFRAGSAPLVNRILREVQSGQYLFDIVSGKVGDLILLKHKGVLGQLPTHELGSYDARFKDPEGYLVDIYSNYYTVGYNKTLVPENRVPKSWEDLLNPQWGDEKIALDPRAYDWHRGSLMAWGEKKGKDFMGKLREQRLAFRQGNVLITNLLVAGEFPLAITYAHLLERAHARGAPIDWLSLSPMVAIPIALALPMESAHPNAAKLFANLVLSKEGATLLSKMKRVPTRKDVDPLAKRLDPKNLDLFPLHLSSEKLRPKEFRKFFGLD